jgi:uncharacterized membrane protein YeaQ/YmgE (transglycosylase-associated protein family)
LIYVKGGERRRMIMNLEMFVTWVIVGLFTGWLARIVLKDGGYGLLSDLILGLVGSGAANMIVAALNTAPETGGSGATALVAFAGAAVVIVGQRKMYAHA